MLTSAVYLAIAAIAVAMLVSLGHALRRAAEVRQRVQAAVVFSGALVAFLFPSLAVLAFFPLGWSFSFTWVTSLLLFFPVSILYAVVRYDLLGAERFIRITVGYAVASAAVLLVYAVARLHARPARRARRLAQRRPAPSRSCSASRSPSTRSAAGCSAPSTACSTARVLDAGRVLEEAGTELATLPDEAAILRLAPERLREALHLEWVEFGRAGRRAERRRAPRAGGVSRRGSRRAARRPEALGRALERGRARARAGPRGAARAGAAQRALPRGAAPRPRRRCGGASVSP